MTMATLPRGLDSSDVLNAAPILTAAPFSLASGSAKITASPKVNMKSNSNGAPALSSSDIRSLLGKYGNKLNRDSSATSSNNLRNNVPFPSNPGNHGVCSNSNGGKSMGSLQAFLKTQKGEASIEVASLKKTLLSSNPGSPGPSNSIGSTSNGALQAFLKTQKQGANIEVASVKNSLLSANSEGLGPGIASGSTSIASKLEAATLKNSLLSSDRDCIGSCSSGSKSIGSLQAFLNTQKQGANIEVASLKRSLLSSNPDSPGPSSSSASTYIQSKLEVASLKNSLLSCNPDSLGPSSNGSESIGSLQAFLNTQRGGANIEVASLKKSLLSSNPDSPGPSSSSGSTSIQSQLEVASLKNALLSSDRDSVNTSSSYGSKSIQSKLEVASLKNSLLSSDPDSLGPSSSSASNSIGSLQAFLNTQGGGASIEVASLKKSLLSSNPDSPGPCSSSGSTSNGALQAFLKTQRGGASIEVASLKNSILSSNPDSLGPCSSSGTASIQSQLEVVSLKKSLLSSYSDSLGASSSYGSKSIQSKLEVASLKSSLLSSEPDSLGPISSGSKSIGSLQSFLHTQRGRGIIEVASLRDSDATGSNISQKNGHFPSSHSSCGLSRSGSKSIGSLQAFLNTQQGVASVEVASLNNNAGPRNTSLSTNNLRELLTAKRRSTPLTRIAEFTAFTEKEEDISGSVATDINMGMFLKGGRRLPNSKLNSPGGDSSSNSEDTRSSSFGLGSLGSRSAGSLQALLKTQQGGASIKVSSLNDAGPRKTPSSTTNLAALLKRSKPLTRKGKCTTFPGNEAAEDIATDAKMGLLLRKERKRINSKLSNEVGDSSSNFEARSSSFGLGSLGSKSTGSLQAFLKGQPGGANIKVASVNDAGPKRTPSSTTNLSALLPNTAAIKRSKPLTRKGKSTTFPENPHDLSEDVSADAKTNLRLTKRERRRSSNKLAELRSSIGNSSNGAVPGLRRTGSNGSTSGLLPGLRRTGSNGSTSGVLPGLKRTFAVTTDPLPRLKRTISSSTNPLPGLKRTLSHGTNQITRTLSHGSTQALAALVGSSKNNQDSNARDSHPPDPTFFEMIKWNPMDEEERQQYDDTAARKYVRRNAEALQSTYSFPVGSSKKGSPLRMTVQRYPLAQLVSLGASLSTVRLAIKAFPGALQSTPSNSGGMSVLHVACTFLADLDVVQYIYNKHPPAIAQTTQLVFLPLHNLCACTAKSIQGKEDHLLDLIHFLVEEYPEGLMAINKLGDTPLRTAQRNQAMPPEVTEYLQRETDAIFALEQNRDRQVDVSERQSWGKDAVLDMQDQIQKGLSAAQNCSGKDEDPPSAEFTARTEDESCCSAESLLSRDSSFASDLDQEVL